MNYYSILTPVGIAEFVNAQAAGVVVPITHMAIGDGGGAFVTPTETQKTLVREVHRVPISDISVDPDNPNWLVIRGVVPATVGGFTVRELSLIGGVGAGGKTLALCNHPDFYKPMASENTTSELIAKFIMQVSNTSVVSMVVEPSAAIATTTSVANAIAAHLQAVNPHPQYALAADLAQHILAANPHPQYAKAADLGAHSTALDPHPQYISVDELDAALSGVMAAIKPNLALLHFRTTM
jgi:phage-related tail fiber protein